MADKVTVTELNRRVKELLTSTPYLHDFWLVGEISNYKLYSSGHAYFTLKDSGAAVSAVMFRGSLSRVTFKPGDSMKVEAYGHVDLYSERGSYQFIVEAMRPAGVGELYQEYERLKKKLSEEGLFDSSRKRKLPRYPRVIGVVTSPTGAVIHDILTTTKRLYPVDVLLAPALVQGDGAAESIVHGINILNAAGVDVIIVGRGGGSLEDLWAFNEEPVVRAIAASRVPVISSVGHETDTTLSDFAADMRAPTPTGAAEMAVRDKVEIAREVEDLMRRAGNGLGLVLGNMHLEFERAEKKLNLRNAQQMVAMHQVNLDRLFDGALRAVEDKVGDMHLSFERTEKKLNLDSARHMVSMHQMNLERLFDRAVRAIGDKVNLMHRRFDSVPDAGSALSGTLLRSRSRAEQVFPRPDIAMKDIVSASRLRYSGTCQRVEPSIIGLERRRADLSAVSARIDALSPYSVLERGYSFVAGPDGRAITSVEGIEVGGTVTIRMRDGRAQAEIRSKEKLR